jgi:hypothetical protein
MEIEEGDRERGRGAQWKRGKGQGFTGKMPFFLPWLVCRIERGGGRRLG